MAGTFTVNGSNTTIRFEYTATTVKIQDVLGAAARVFYDLDAVETPLTKTFDQLTNQEKLNLVDKYVRKYVNNAALQKSVADAVATATIAADANLSV
jgi:hypothetical protein